MTLLIANTAKGFTTCLDFTICECCVTATAYSVVSLKGVRNVFEEIVVSLFEQHKEYTHNSMWGFKLKPRAKCSMTISFMVHFCFQGASIDFAVEMGWFCFFSEGNIMLFSKFKLPHERGRIYNFNYNILLTSNHINSTGYAHANQDNNASFFARWEEKGVLSVFIWAYSLYQMKPPFLHASWTSHIISSSLAAAEQLLMITSNVGRRTRHRGYLYPLLGYYLPEHWQPYVCCCTREGSGTF